MILTSRRDILLTIAGGAAAALTLSLANNSAASKATPVSYSCANAKRGQREFREFEFKRSPNEPYIQWRCRGCGIHSSLHEAEYSRPGLFYRCVSNTECKGTLRGDVTDFECGMLVKRVGGAGPESGTVWGIDRDKSTLNFEHNFPVKRHYPAHNYRPVWGMIRALKFASYALAKTSMRLLHAVVMLEHALATFDLCDNLMEEEE